MTRIPLGRRVGGIEKRWLKGVGHTDFESDNK